MCRAENENEPAKVEAVSSLGLVDTLQDAVDFVNCIILAANSLTHEEKNAFARVAGAAINAIETVQSELPNFEKKGPAEAATSPSRGHR